MYRFEPGEWDAPFVPSSASRCTTCVLRGRFRRSSPSRPPFTSLSFFPSQEEADELKMSLRAVSQNLDALEAGGLMWHEVPAVDPFAFASTFFSMIDIMCTFARQFLVIIIVDGREKMSKSMLEYCEKDLKIWQTEMLKYEHRNNEVCTIASQCTPAATVRESLDIKFCQNQSTGNPAICTRMAHQRWFISLRF